MADAQNERTNSGGRRRGRRGQRRRGDQEKVIQQAPEPVVEAPPVDHPATPVQVASTESPWVRPSDIAAPEEKLEVYCMHHLAVLPDQEPINTRTNMTTIRHLAVDHFGEATLFCDCLHNGPHEWPPTLQKLETAIELDQFITASTREA